VRDGAERALRDLPSETCRQWSVSRVTVVRQDLVNHPGVNMNQTDLQRNRTFVSRQLQEKAGGVTPSGLFSWCGLVAWSYYETLTGSASNRCFGCTSSSALSTMRISVVPRAAVNSSTA